MGIRLRGKKPRFRFWSHKAVAICCCRNLFDDGIEREIATLGSGIFEAGYTILLGFYQSIGYLCFHFSWMRDPHKLEASIMIT